MTKWGTAPWQTRLFLKHRGRLRRLRNICAEHSILDGVRLGNHPFYRCPLKDLSEHRGTPFRQLLSLKMSVRLTALTSANRADEIYAAPRAALQTQAAPDRRCRQRSAQRRCRRRLRRTAAAQTPVAPDRRCPGRQRRAQRCRQQRRRRAGPHMPAVPRRQHHGAAALILRSCWSVH